jgi:hypothetical protein
VHPELGCERETQWLDREDPVFVVRYLETRALLSAAMTSDEPVLMDGGTATVYGPRAWESYKEFAAPRPAEVLAGAAKEGGQR